jgi:hypothetical protein
MNVMPLMIVDYNGDEKAGCAPVKAFRLMPLDGGYGSVRIDPIRTGSGPHCLWEFETSMMTVEILIVILAHAE